MRAADAEGSLRHSRRSNRWTREVQIGALIQIEHDTHRRANCRAQHQPRDHGIGCSVLPTVAQRSLWRSQTRATGMSYGRQSPGSCGHPICTIHIPTLRRISEEDLCARKENEQTDAIDTIFAFRESAAPKNFTEKAIDAAQEREEAAARKWIGGTFACKAGVCSCGDLHRSSWRTDDGTRAVSPSRIGDCCGAVASDSARGRKCAGGSQVAARYCQSGRATRHAEDGRVEDARHACRCRDASSLREDGEHAGSRTGEELACGIDGHACCYCGIAVQNAGCGIDRETAGNRFDGEGGCSRLVACHHHGVPQVRRRDFLAEGHDRRGCAEVAQLEMGFPEEALLEHRARGCVPHVETAELRRPAHHRDRHALERRDAGAIGAKRCGFL